jgi:hypothetical protein
MLGLVIIAFLVSCAMTAQAGLPLNPAIEEGLTSYSAALYTSNVQSHKPSFGVK